MLEYHLAAWMKVQAKRSDIAMSTDLLNSRAMN